MLKHRVIPSLLLREGGLVKTTRFGAAQYIGDPVNAVRIFNEKEVDELVLLDIDASRTGRSPDVSLVRDVAGECFMPLCYGGGIRSLEDAAKLFDSGVEKICLQTGALRDMSLISRIADRYGSQSVLFSVDLRRSAGRVTLYEPATGRGGHRPWEEVVASAEAAGAGEILVTAVDRDGTLGGPDVEMVRDAASLVGVPVVSAGGIASLEDIRAAVLAGASAVAVGAWFVLYGPHRAVLITYPEYAALERALAGVP